MPRIIPCKEPTPSEPRGPRNISDKRIFKNEEFFGFDTETTRCELKELRSYQAEWLENGVKRCMLIALKGWYSKTSLDSLKKTLGNRISIKIYSKLSTVRKHVQISHEELIFGKDKPRLKKSKKGKWYNVKRKVIRCAVGFNGNFDLGAMADTCIFSDETNIGGMEGAGCDYAFHSGKRQTENKVYGLKMKALYLGAANVPYLPKRGLLWDIQPAANQVWGCSSLKAVGNHIGLKKLDFDERDPFYAMMDASITRLAACKLSDDILNMNFKGFPDRFISAATISKDLMRQKYNPFFIDGDMHNWIWPAYFGGMTGATNPQVLQRELKDVVYGDLDGAYSASAINLKVFNWDGAKWITAKQANKMIKEIRENPNSYWKYGGLHLEVEGDFDKVPVRVANIGEASEANPSSSQGLVWAKMRNYKTVLSVGDYLHCEPKKHKIIKGLIHTMGKNDNEDLFKLCATERNRFPKNKYPVQNRWWKNAGNSIYGCFAQRNGKERLDAGVWFNSILASSITGAIRHAMWIVNETAGDSSHYNDTDSALLDRHVFEDCKKALGDIGIGFTNKTNDELENTFLAKIAIVQGSKRYALQNDKIFGAKCHGLGSWFILKNGRAVSIAHDEEILENVWKANYPQTFGEPNWKLLDSPVFHKFSIRTKKVSNLVIRYCCRKYKNDDWTKYGKAGNFGFLSPTKPNIDSKKIVPEVSYEPEDASNISQITLGMVALGWGSSKDKKYNYETMQRHLWYGEDVREVEAVARTQDLVRDDDLDISIDVRHLNDF
tara:strand:- start:275 stop:2605 length:2331 start_codon:yes stop_codon:yes gene_type:complete